MKKKKTSKKQLLILIAVLILFIIRYGISMNTSKDYESIYISDVAYMKLAKNKNVELIEKGDSFVYMAKDEIKVLGVETPCKNINQDVVEQMGISDELINETGNVKSKEQLQNLYMVNQSELIDTDEFNKPNFSTYLLRYKESNEEVIIFVYETKENSVVQIIKCSEGTFNDSEIENMYEGLGIY